MDMREDTGQRGRRARDWLRLLTAGVFLVFLYTPFAETVSDLPHGWAWVGLGTLIVFCGVYAVHLTTVRVMNDDPRKRTVRGIRWIAFGLVATALTAPSAGDTSLIMLVYISALTAAMLPTLSAVITVAAMTLLSVVAGAVIPGWSTDGVQLAIILASVATWSFRRQEVSKQREVAVERELSEVAVDRERTKIAQDLHDILGHSLTVIAMKSELAEKLLDADPDRARTELEQVQQLARDALADVRATTHGLQGRSLPTEIAAARQALDSAGIDARLPTVTDDIPSRERELFAWTVREAVTNVLRHSGARTCTIDARPGRLTVTDDGRGADDQGSQGSGLAGLRRRAADVGAVVTTAAGPDGRGFRLTVEVK